MSASFNNIVLLERHSYSIFSRALTEGVVNVYVNEKQVPVSVKGFPQVDWSEIVATLLLHERILLSDMDMAPPDVDFPGGKLRISFPTKPKQKKSFLNALTSPPTIRDWLFPEVLRASNAFSAAANEEYLQFQMFLDFFRIEQFVSKIVGEDLLGMSKSLGKALGFSEKSFSFVKDPREFALSIGAVYLMMQLKTIKDRQGSILSNAGSYAFLQSLVQKPGKQSEFLFYFDEGMNIKKRFDDKGFNLLLGLFQVLLIKYIPFYNQILNKADSVNACVLADARFASLDQVPPKMVDQRHESKIIETFRVVLGEEQEGWRPPDMSLRDVLRIRQEPWIVGFRESVRRVVDAISRGKKDEVQAARDEYFKTRKKFRTHMGLEKVGSIITYMSVPLSLVEPLLGSFVGGISCSAIGAIMHAGSKKLLQQAEWIARLP